MIFTTISIVRSFDTGSEIVDQIFTVLLSSSMFIGGLVGFILDNTVPGTAKERGLLAWNKQAESSSASADYECYNLPYITKYLHKLKWAKYIPLSPTFEGFFAKK